MIAISRRSGSRRLSGLIGFAGLAAAAVAAIAPGAASAQAFPDRPIRFIVPTAPSTPPDLISRIIAAEISKAEGWTVVVENKGGGSQTIAAREVLRAAPDGYTVFVPSMVIAAVPALLPDAHLDIDKDFTPVVKMSVSYNALVVNPSVEAKTVADLVALLKANPGKLNYASGGYGTPAHLIGELFLAQAGATATHVPFQALPQAFTELMAGRNQYMFATTLPITPFVKDGKLRALAVTSPRRMDEMPDIPTIAEAGFPSLSVADWVVLMMRRETPPAIVARINAAVNKALKTDAVRQAFKNIGGEPAGGTPEELGAFMSQQVAFWTKVVKDAGIKLPN